MSEWQIEMTWRCSSCRHQNRGRDTVCAQCGDPKDASEQYEMPADPASAPAVVDPALLRVAHGGANWRCGYCGSDQRRADGRCAQCGAASAEGTTPPVDATARAVANLLGGVAAPPPRVRARAVAPRGSGLGVLLLAVPAVLCVLGLVMAFALRRPPGAYVPAQPAPPREVSAIVQRVAWERAIHVERYRAWTREGFAESRPASAFHVTSLGQRVHHQEQVQDGFDTQTYTEQEQQGFDTQTYTERVQCGQDCTALPQTCTTNCTPNGNGFATCRNECTGGGQSCSPRYCDEPRTRQVPRMVTVTRTRQVPRYRSEPRYAEWFRWDNWEWAEARVARANGAATTDLRWPDDEARVGADVPAGEQERARREERYTVELAYGAGRTWTYAPASEPEFVRFAVGSRHVLRADDYGNVQLADPPPPPAVGAPGAPGDAAAAARDP